MTRTFGRQDDPDIDSVWLWFEFQAALVGEERGCVLQTLRPGSGPVVDARRPRDSRFLGLTRTEVEKFFDAQEYQLELLTMFELLATTEAVLRIEFKGRVATRKKDGLSRRFREIHKASAEKVQFDEHILAARKEEGVAANVIGDFRGTLKLRNWLAHGRHWPPKFGCGYAPGDVFDIARALILKTAVGTPADELSPSAASV